jgi:hypothetical protein
MLEKVDDIAGLNCLLFVATLARSDAGGDWIHSLCYNHHETLCISVFRTMSVRESKLYGLVS